MAVADALSTSRIGKRGMYGRMASSRLPRASVPNKAIAFSTYFLLHGPQARA